MYPAIPESVEKVLSLVRAINPALSHHLYLVGGAVRDILLGIEPLDFDFVFEGSANLFVKGKRRNLDNFKITSKYFDSCSFNVEGRSINLSSARRDIYLNMKLIGIERAEIKEDLKRRDFTINAMALDHLGKLLDPLNGQEDLDKKILRNISRKSFEEDPSRLIRACRYIRKLNLKPSKETEKEFWNSLRFISPNDKRVIKEIERTNVKKLLNQEYFKAIKALNLAL